MSRRDQLQLSRLFSDGMVLQRNTPIKIWGFAPAGAKISIRFLEVHEKAVTDESGKWELFLPELEAGGSYEMVITSEDGEEKRIRDIFIGDVWIASGQSNMELSMERLKDLYPEDIVECYNSKIRLFKVAECYDFHRPKEDLDTGEWQMAKPETILNFSAVSYYFEKYMYEYQPVPIGIINVSLGGSPIEAWLREEALAEFKQYRDTLKRYQDDSYLQEQVKQNEEDMKVWMNKLNETDNGSTARIPWYSHTLEDLTWEEAFLPDFFENIGIKDFIGAVWFRKKVRIPSSMIKDEVRLWLGTIVDSDIVFINGVEAGSTKYQYPPRKYTIPPNLLKAGENTIAIRVVCENGKGRFTPGKWYGLFTKNHCISLEGRWKYRIGCFIEKRRDTNFVNWKPTGLYNGMLAPCIPYTIKGFLWYQGEANTKSPREYKGLFTKLIQDWREQWQQGDLPFLYVQLPNFSIDLPKENSGWPEIREAQLQTLALPKTAMVTAIDLGEENDLHPLQKKEIGYRFSLAARALAFGDKVEYAGPLVDSASQRKNEVILQFSHAENEMEWKNGTVVSCVQIAGSNSIFYPANVKIEGKEMIVWSDLVSKPIEVRYAYENSPTGALLYNKEGLPASPFRIKIEE